MPGLTLLLQDDHDPCRRRYAAAAGFTYAAQAGGSYPAGVPAYAADPSVDYDAAQSASYAPPLAAGYGGSGGVTYPAGTGSYPAGTAAYTAGTADYDPDDEPSYGGCDGTE